MREWEVKRGLEREETGREETGEGEEAREPVAA